jgi:hypothetical protein
LRHQHAIVIYIEPDGWEDEQARFSAALNGFTPSQMTIQPRRTITISLNGTEDEWLERMKQKTRYNIRLAEKKGVIVMKSSDVDAFNALMRVTGERDHSGSIRIRIIAPHMKSSTPNKPVNYSWLRSKTGPWPVSWF